MKELWKNWVYRVRDFRDDHPVVEAMAWAAFFELVMVVIGFTVVHAGSSLAAWQLGSLIGLPMAALFVIARFQLPRYGAPPGDMLGFGEGAAMMINMLNGALFLLLVSAILVGTWVGAMLRSVSIGFAFALILSATWACAFMGGAMVFTTLMIVFLLIRKRIRQRKTIATSSM